MNYILNKSTYIIGFINMKQKSNEHIVAIFEIKKSLMNYILNKSNYIIGFINMKQKSNEN